MMKSSLSSPSYRPLYDQIKILITQSLMAGEWRPGAAIPSELDLAARFGVSQGTVRKAIDELAAENILVRKQGKGTFVASHCEERSQTRFLRIVRDTGEIEPTESRLLDCRRERASEAVAQLLDLRAGTPIYVLKRILALSGKPLIVDNIHLPAALFRGLDAAQISEYKASMYSFFETRYGIVMTHAQERLKAVAADPESARLLAVPAHSPLLCVDRVAYTFGNRAVEWRRGLCNTASHHYANELS
jgi:GntR family transcriptional regulator